MKVRKIIAILMLLIICLSGCSNDSSAAPSSLYAHGLEVIQLMSEMTRTAGYVDAYTANDEIKAIIDNLKVEDYASPKAVYAITVTDEALAAMAELNGIEDMSDELAAFLNQRTLSVIISQINGMGGAMNLAAGSICAASKSFVDAKMSEDVIYIYTYDDAVAAVTFVKGEDGAVYANGTFVMYDGFPCDSLETIAAFFDDVAVNVTEVPLEK